MHNTNASNQTFAKWQTLRKEGHDRDPHGVHRKVVEDSGGKTGDKTSSEMIDEMTGAVKDGKIGLTLAVAAIAVTAEIAIWIETEHAIALRGAIENQTRIVQPQREKKTKRSKRKPKSQVPLHWQDRN